ncbi:hypothetical protein [Amantichitinum ursilacus]|uniref:Uncharacterized protein n=1 Tax=Amantichitinum ursilacus TaxID=857265 RepID=A0A0N0XIH6_9NEIS|nr:hypothetical protein [Amantichitinum ursilacus]KPC50692.1 hypothetical protein WG78_16600 [Amantichitinum ursilacus]
MSVQLQNGRIMLTGICPVGDAQALLNALLDNPDAPLDLSGCRHLHAALWQIALCAGARVGGAPTDPFVEIVCNSGIRTI